MKYNVIVMKILYEMGIHKRYLGVEYITSCINYIENNEDNFAPVTKILYVDVAKLHNTSKYNIEKGIREIIERIWNLEENKNLIKEIFGRGYIAKRPPNTEFLIMLYDYIKSNVKRINEGDDGCVFICPKCREQCPYCKDIVKVCSGK